MALNDCDCEIEGPEWAFPYLVWIASIIVRSAIVVYIFPSLSVDLFETGIKIQLLTSIILAVILYMLLKLAKFEVRPINDIPPIMLLIFFSIFGVSLKEDIGFWSVSFQILIADILFLIVMHFTFRPFANLVKKKR